MSVHSCPVQCGPKSCMHPCILRDRGEAGCHPLCVEAPSIAVITAGVHVESRSNWRPATEKYASRPMSCRPPAVVVTGTSPWTTTVAGICSASPTLHQSRVAAPCAMSFFGVGGRTRKIHQRHLQLTVESKPSRAVSAPETHQPPRRARIDIQLVGTHQGVRRGVRLVDGLGCHSHWSRGCAGDRNRNRT